MNEKMLNETIAEIRNKLQAPKTALDLISSGKDISKNFLETAKRELDKAVELLKSLIS